MHTIGRAIGTLLLTLAASAAHAQSPGNIFVTPIPGVQFSGTVHVERTTLRPDGPALQTWSERHIARDREGRIYNESRPFLPLTVTQLPQANVIHLYDPQNRMSELLYPRRKIYTAMVLNRPPSTDTTDNFASTTALSDQPSDFARQEDLGNRTILGLETHGVRITQILPAAQSGTGKEVSVTNEYWYAATLRMNLLSIHSDPRTGSVTTSVTQIDRSDPPAALFGVPSDYTMAPGR